MRRLEPLALWDERELFTEQGKKERGFLGYIRCCFIFDDSTVQKDDSEWSNTDPVIEYELEDMLHILATEDEGYVLKSPQDMTNFCRERLHDHIPYSFNRECWGFRYLTEDRVWYLALTPWNERQHFTVYGYDRAALMGGMAKERNLPENCYGVLRFTGERIFIRFGASGFESFPQFGGNISESRAFANEKNADAKLTAGQVAAMENGVIYGWDTPLAVPGNYDKEGHFMMPEDNKGGKRK